MSETELKPCPFCGEEFEIHHDQDSDVFYWTHSGDCPMETSKESPVLRIYPTEQTLINDLNSRPAEDALREELESIRGSLANNEVYCSEMLAEAQQAKAERDAALAEVARLKTILAAVGMSYER